MAKFRTIYEEEGREYIFSSINFKLIASKYISIKKKEGKYTQTKLFNRIAQSANVSLEAVKQWYGSYNGPGDIEIVKSIASVMDVNFKELLVEKKQERVMDIKDYKDGHILLTELELIKEVYRDMLDVAVEYSETAGGRYILSMPELRDSSTIYNYYVDLVDKIHDKVDRYALCVDTKTIKKLHIILMEYKQDIVDEPTPERWINNNIDYYKAKRLLLFYKKIGDHSVENNIYGIKDVEPELFDEDAGFETKDTLEDLLKKRLQGLGKKVINQCYITSLRELYLREFAETMMTIFNMDFDLRR